MAASRARAVVHDMQTYVNRFSRYHQSILTIEQFTHFGKHATSEESYRFLKSEVPVRLAHILQEISHLPKNLLSMPSVKLVNSWYTQSFTDLLQFEDEDDCSEGTLERFTNTLHDIKRRHDTTVETMATGIIELREAEGEAAIIPAVQYFLDRFYMSRIGIRLLMTQHLALFREKYSTSSKSRFIGVFEPKCLAKAVVADAIENAGNLCDQFYFNSPDVLIREHNPHEASNEVFIAYVPSHLYFMLFEVMKNAMRATVETHENAVELPKIEVDIVKGYKDITIRITDQGGGIPRSEIENLFSYHYSTAPQPDQGTIAPLAGYGYGLPLSRLYAKYFGGDIQVCSMEGLGTMALLYLKALSEDAHEVLPMYNSFVAKSYQEDYLAGTQQRDWSSNSFYEGQVHSYAKPVYIRSRKEKSKS